MPLDGSKSGLVKTGLTGLVATALYMYKSEFNVVANIAQETSQTAKVNTK